MQHVCRFFCCCCVKGTSLDFMHDVGDTWCSVSSSLRCVSSPSFFTSLNISLNTVGFCPTFSSVGARDSKSTPGAVQVSGRSPLTVTRQRLSASSSIFLASPGAWWKLEGCGLMRCARGGRRKMHHFMLRVPAERWFMGVKDSGCCARMRRRIRLSHRGFITKDLLPEKRRLPH